jgi:hypothetical protein
MLIGNTEWKIVFLLATSDIHIQGERPEFSCQWHLNLKMDRTWS